MSAAAAETTSERADTPDAPAASNPGAPIPESAAGLSHSREPATMSAGSEASATSTSAGSSATQLPLSPLDPGMLSDRIAGEITAAVGRISNGLADGMAPDEIGASVAEQVTQAASVITQEIETALSSAQERALDLTSSLANDLSSTIETELADTLAPVIGGAEPAIDAVPALGGSITDKVGEVVDTGLAALPELSSLDVPGKALADIPASLLGAEDANDLPGGILSSIFYSDGGSDLGSGSGPGLAAPAAEPAIDVFSDQADALSDAAAGMTGIAGDLAAIDFAGVSYSDTSDAAYGGMTSGLNALHLL